MNTLVTMLGTVLVVVLAFLVWVQQYGGGDDEDDKHDFRTRCIGEESLGPALNQGWQIAGFAIGEDGRPAWWVFRCENCHGDHDE